MIYHGCRKTWVEIAGSLVKLQVFVPALSLGTGWMMFRVSSSLRSSVIPWRSAGFSQDPVLDDFLRRVQESLWLSQKDVILSLFIWYYSILLPFWMIVKWLKTALETWIIFCPPAFCHLQSFRFFNISNWKNIRYYEVFRSPS